MKINTLQANLKKYKYLKIKPEMRFTHRENKAILLLLIFWAKKLI